MKIADYCKTEVDGWTQLPTAMLVPHPGKEHLTMGFLSDQGVQLIVSIRDEETIHASLALLVSSFPNTSDQERMFMLGNMTPAILCNFFGDELADFPNKWKRMPDDERKPDVKHWFRKIA